MSTADTGTRLEKAFSELEFFSCVLAFMKPALRRLFRSPMFTGITLLTLTIGIGANTAIFSVLNGVLLKPLPYPDSNRLVGVWETAHLQGLQEVNASPATYLTFREENHTMQGIGLWRHGSANITGSGEPEQVDTLDVSEDLLPVLGVPPFRGRWFTPKDDQHGSPKTAILSYAYWQRKFGGDESAIGRRLIVDGESSEIIGIMPPDFNFMSRNLALITPLQLDRSKVFIGNFSYQTVARLKPGVTLAQVNADVGRMLPMMLDKFAPAPGISIQMFKDAAFGPSVRLLKKDVVGDVGTVLWVLMGTIGVVLFIACANVANLMLVRAEGRQQELAIRAALGAGWPRIARELLAESVSLGLTGGVLGVLLAKAAIRLLVYLHPANLPRLTEVAIDPRVLLFALAISLGAGVLFGLIPVFKYAGPHLAGALRQGGRGASEGRERHRARNVLVVVQVALALVLLIGSGLMIRTVRALKQVQPGFTHPEQILTMTIAIPDALVPKPEQVARTYDNILQKVAAIPGVTAVGLTNSVTMDGYSDNDPIFAADHQYAAGRIPPLRRYKFISPGYFKAMGNHILAGRDLTWTDIYEGRSVVLVSEALARELWHDPAAALGKQVRETPSTPWREVIGVAGDERDDGANHKASTMVYWPLLIKKFWGQPEIALRGEIFAIRSTRTGSASLLNEVRRAVWSVNSDLPIANVRTVEEVYQRSMARTSFTLVMLSIAASMALLLGIVGIYGVISYAVSQRTREIGIRIALGAPRQSVLQMFVRQGLALTAIGVACGMAAAALLTRLMSTLLFGVSALDPVTYAAVSLGLALAAVLASYIPARRATSIQPVEALRVE